MQARFANLPHPKQAKGDDVPRDSSPAINKCPGWIFTQKKWQDWEIPHEGEKSWPEPAGKAHAAWWEARISRQKEIDASIAAKAEFEYLYDKPYEDKKKARVAGPFTVESLSPHRTLGLDENDDLIDSLRENTSEYGAKQTFPQMILENLKVAGVQQAHKADRISFTSVVPWPGELVCAEGRYMEGDKERRAAIFIGPEFGTVQRADLVAAAREAGDASFDVLIACAFNYEAHTTEFAKLGRLPVLKARMNADLHMADDLKTTGKGNLFIIFGEPDIEIRHEEDGRLRLKINGVDVFKPQTGEVISDGADGIACWFVDTDYNEESFFVRHAYFLGANDPYNALKTTLKAEIDADAGASLHSDTSRPFEKPKKGRIAVKVINHLGDEVMKVFKGLVVDFRIADTFTDSLARLTGDEQKAVKTTAFDLQLDPANPGMQFHKLDKAKDKNFWSVRVNDDIRLIVHRSAGSLLLCYVNHHDKAYDWAERRKLETHPNTGAAQLVEIRETVKEIVVPLYVQAEVTKKPSSRPPRKEPICSGMSDEEILGYGVPPEWLGDVKKANDDTLLSLTDHLPAEAAEALLELATGGKPRPPQPAVRSGSPFDHPDALRRFRVMSNVGELERALDYPWEKWTIFLHPDQRQMVERDYKGPARVSGSAGTGKTIVALHRAGYLARENPDARVLLTTFSDPLASALQTKLRRLLGNEPRLGERIDVGSLTSVGLRLYKAHVGNVTVAGESAIRKAIQEASSKVPDHKFTERFLWTEWDQVADAWQLETWDAYRDVARLGRKTRLPEAQRKILWSIFEKVRAHLMDQGVKTHASIFTALATALAREKRTIYDFTVIDESQDLGIPHLRFLAALGGGRPNGLFFAGDLGQRIFQQPFSWKALGIDVRGRSKTLRVNYRTSHQIRSQADLLLNGSLTDVDGNKEERDDTVSVFNGPPPAILRTKNINDEAKTVGKWLADRSKAGVQPHELGVFVRSPAELERAQAALKESGLAFKVLDEHVEVVTGHVSVGTMHLAKGLEFRAVVVMACDDEVIPSQERIESVGDDADLEEVYDTERQLLYVACTRARDELLVTGVEPASEFLDDLLALG